MFTFKYGIDPADWSQFTHAGHARLYRLLGYWWTYSQYALLAALVIIVAGFLPSSFLVGDPADYAAFLVAGWFICGLAGCVTTAKWSRLALKENGPYRAERTVRFSPDEIETANTLMTVRTAWAAVDSVSTHRDILVLWTDPAAGIIVPRRVLANAEEEGRFLEFVNQQIVGARKLNPS